MSGNQERGPRAVLKRMYRALNDRDLDAYVSCYAPHYQSEQPIHPDWTYSGRETLRWNWTGIFENVQDFKADLLRSTVDGDTVWSEWHWSGVQPDGVPLNIVGVIIMGVEEDQIIWGRIYMESQAGARLSFNEGRERPPRKLDA
jgi:ketosteroid isomerase-like protein